MNFLELERKCKKIRFFKVLKLVFLLFFLLSIALGIYLFLYKKNSLVKKQEQKLIENNIKKEIENKKDNKKGKNNKKDENKDENNKKTDKMLELKFEVNLQELYQSYKNRIAPKPKKEDNLKKESKKEIIEKKDKVKKEIVIKSKNLPSYNVCIKLAKKYYEKGDYKQALKWAKNANIQDNKKAGSWIITAKTLYKMGKKDEAIKLLEIYYSYTQDEKIKNLIKNMK